jgi:hypothetical protein
MQASSSNGLSATHHINHSILATTSTAIRQPPVPIGRPSLPFDNNTSQQLFGRLSLGSMGGGQLSSRGQHPFLTPRGSTGSIGSLQAGSNGTDLRQEIRGLKLQELQWRLLNARMQHSMKIRKQKVGTPWHGVDEVGNHFSNTATTTHTQCSPCTSV